MVIVVADELLVEVAEAIGAIAQLAGGLRTTQQQQAEKADLLGTELKAAEPDVGKAMFVLGHPAAKAAAIANQVLFYQPIDNPLDPRVTQVHDRLATALLVTGGGKGRQRQRVLCRCRYLFFEQAADHARLGWCEFDVHGGFFRSREYGTTS